MKNLIQKSAVFLIVSLLFISCSKNDTESTKQAFFNLKVGNSWVYKEYSSSDQNTVPSFTGNVDTVKIVSIENIKGLTFAKKSTKRVLINYGGANATTYSYVRVNNLGHLIEVTDDYDLSTLSETSGMVLHPGFDTNFSFNQIILTSSNDPSAPDSYGNIIYHVDKSLNMVVEGNSYLVSPYIGIFTPSPNYPDLVSETSPELYYTQNLGLVKSVTRTLSGDGILEKRLVSYKLN